MKNRSSAIKLVAVAVMFITLLASHASAANNPIPGIDIVVRKQPGGSAITTATGKEGRFVFTDLEAGTYVLSIALPKMGTQIALVQTAEYELKEVLISSLKVARSPSSPLGPPVTAELIVREDKGRITGTVEEATEESFWKYDLYYPYTWNASEGWLYYLEDKEGLWIYRYNTDSWIKPLKLSDEKEEGPGAIGPGGA